MSAPLSPSGESVGDQGRVAGSLPPASLIVLIAVLLVIRLFLAGAMPLTEDEAYYRLWARAPAFGYFDHPPMVAWWIWLGTHLVGDTALGVRLLAIMGSAVSSLLVFDIARLARGARADALRASVWYNAMPLVAAGGFLAIPDAPATLFWVLTLWALARALRAGVIAWWLAAGVAAGLATLSKYSALFLGPGVLLWLTLSPSGRGSLRTAGPWVALCAAGALFSLNVWWNADHHWITFAKQFGRITPHQLAPRYLLEFLVSEALLLNPVLAVFLARPAEPGHVDARQSLPFIATSAPFVIYLLIHSLHDRIQAHWPAPVYPAVAIWAAFAASRSAGPWRHLRALVPWFGFSVSGFAAIYLALPLAGIPLAFDPALPLREWPAFSRSVEALRVSNQAAWIGTTSYGLAAQLMDEPAIDAPVLQISERARWEGLKSGRAADTTRPGLLVDLQRRIDPANLGRCFGEVRVLGTLDRGIAGEKTKRYAVVLVSRPLRDVAAAGCGADVAPGL
jgi:4-amino-4-deoxy-L-arabinose transferase-like glycosyltransferase